MTNGHYTENITTLATHGGRLVGIKAGEHFTLPWPLDIKHPPEFAYINVN